jgi:hypothetical protein
VELELYVVARPNGRWILFSPPQILDSFDSLDRIRQAIDWFARRQNRVTAWIGRKIQSLHDYYLKIEEKIDPSERVLKAMAATNRFVVYTNRPTEFYRVLRRQLWKHVFWFSIDFVLTGVVIVFTPFLAPIPGPNVFLYYPLLRLLSHYRALRGASAGLHATDLEFKRPEGLLDRLVD